MLTRLVQNLALLAITSLVSHCFSATTHTLFQGRATESITINIDPESGAALTKQVGVNYHQLSYLKSFKYGLIARETIRSTYLENTEGGISSATVELYYGHADKTYSAYPDHATTVAEASEIRFNTDHWTAKITGCCDAELILQMFAYGKSTPFLYANSRYAQVNLPNADINRYIGVVLRAQAPEDDINKAVFGNNKRAVAAILYASPEKPLQKLLLEPKPGVSEADLPYHTEGLTLKSASSKDKDGYNQDSLVSKVLTMWSQDTKPGQLAPTTVSGFSIIATFAGNDSKPERVVIPVKNDCFGKPRLSGQTLQVAE